MRASARQRFPLVRQLCRSRSNNLAEKISEWLAAADETRRAFWYGWYWLMLDTNCPDYIANSAQSNRAQTRMTASVRYRVGRYPDNPVFLLSSRIRAGHAPCYNARILNERWGGCCFFHG